MIKKQVIIHYVYHPQVMTFFRDSLSQVIEVIKITGKLECSSFNLFLSNPRMVLCLDLVAINMNFVKHSLLLLKDFYKWDPLYFQAGEFFTLGHLFNHLIGIGMDIQTWLYLIRLFTWAQTRVYNNWLVELIIPPFIRS